MGFNPDIHHRQSIRLQGFDYVTAGAYFVTMCTHQRECLFGEIRNGEIQTNDIGKIVDFWCHEISHHFCGVTVDDSFVIMPNHIHMIVWLHDVGADRCVCPIKENACPTDNERPLMDGPIPTLGTHIGVPLPTVVQWLKTMTTNAYFRYMKSNNIEFRNRLWQRNYYERVVRNECELSRIQKYIAENPRNWDVDPDRIAS